MTNPGISCAELFVGSFPILMKWQMWLMNNKSLGN
jgi:hypothetical protein